MASAGTNHKGGRKSLVDEKIRSAVINKSWDYLAKVFNDDQRLKLDLTDKDKAFIAKDIAKATIPKNMDVTSNGKEMSLSILFNKSDGDNEE